MTEWYVYIDDSGGSDPAQDIAIAAGWVIRARQRKDFEDAWKSIADKYCFSCFHATDAMASAPGSDFEGWAEHRKAAALRAIRTALCRHTAGGFVFSITRQDYDGLVPSEQQPCDTHFGFALQMLIERYAEWRTLNRIGSCTHPTRFVISRLPKGASHQRRDVERIFSRLAATADAASKFGISRDRTFWSFGTPGDHPALQGADLLAWLAKQRSADQILLRGERRDYVRTTWNALKQHRVSGGAKLLDSKLLLSKERPRQTNRNLEQGAAGSRGTA